MNRSVGFSKCCYTMNRLLRSKRTLIFIVLNWNKTKIKAANHLSMLRSSYINLFDETTLWYGGQLWFCFDSLTTSSQHLIIQTCYILLIQLTCLYRCKRNVVGLKNQPFGENLRKLNLHHFEVEYTQLSLPNTWYKRLLTVSPWIEPEFHLYSIDGWYVQWWRRIYTSIPVKISGTLRNQTRVASAMNQHHNH